MKAFYDLLDDIHRIKKSLKRKGEWAGEIMEHLSSDELLKLYFDFTRYRDSECSGLAEMSIKEFYLRVYINV